MGEILFIAHRIPFPPDRGDKIRSHHLLKALARLGPVHVATLGETEADFAAEPMLAKVAASYCLAGRRANLPLAGLRALIAGEPVSLAAFFSPRLRKWIDHTLSARPIEAIFVFSGQMGQYVPASYAGRVVVDLCDVDSAKFEAYAAKGSPPRRWIDAREGRLLAAEEARLARRASTTLLVSEAEAALFRGRAGSGAVNVRALGNGVDATFFHPDVVEPHSALAAAPGPNLVFTGQMDYPPNIAAAERTARDLMPSVRAVYPQARFHVVGRAPSAQVRSLEGLHGTRVWGEVPDVRPFVAAANLVIAPLTIARGIQNKVLEAMAMARPVLLTPAAAEGIGGSDGIHYAVGEDNASLAAHVLRLLDDPPARHAMGVAARHFVIESMSWDAVLAPLAEMVGCSASEAVRDAA
ncbi:glycosyl transferase [Tsuneonella deserti]|uniref:Glycosyl transferase n=1 Tax=Tsuneonella deserti TaxID=2035528 RepID=A0ABQ1S7Z9_9SPHN|nr:TIGR03087 family PEP-CTERM/XrtA system glycosyltransferase [Tsuneonella deserti]GGD93338.1 glycosyl transferase [Tsuneonella deserti]